MSAQTVLQNVLHLKHECATYTPDYTAGDSDPMFAICCYQWLLCSLWNCVALLRETLFVCWLSHCTGSRTPNLHRCSRAALMQMK